MFTRCLKIALVSLMLVAAAQARDRANTTYVGGGRYTCTGGSAQCAQVRQNNEALEAQRRAAGEARRAREEVRRDAPRVWEKQSPYSWERPAR